MIATESLLGYPSFFLKIWPDVIEQEVHQYSVFVCLVPVNNCQKVIEV